jgi:magnesium-transporting ATPase (P-type)
VLSVFDPPRVDTKATIEAAYANGVEVKMITGDQTAIAVETCRMLGMGTKVRCSSRQMRPALPLPGALLRGGRFLGCMRVHLAPPPPFCHVETVPPLLSRAPLYPPLVSPICVPYLCPLSVSRICVHLPPQILNTEALNADFSKSGTTLGEVILSANGFAEVYPEHKFQSTCGVAVLAAS